MKIITCQVCRKQFICNRGTKQVKGCGSLGCSCPICYMPNGWKEYPCWEGIENPYSLYSLYEGEVLEHSELRCEI